MSPAHAPRCAFVHTDRRQYLTALVCAYSLRKQGGDDGCFDVRLLTVEGTCLDERSDGRPIEGQPGGTFDHTDPTIFSFLRRSVPEQMNYRGRAVVIDPDIIALRSLRPLFDRDMGDAAILSRYLESGYLGLGTPYYGTAVMVLDCARLTHWSLSPDFDAYLAGEADYWDLVFLRLEPPGAVGRLEEEWNSLDHLTPRTRLLHFTRPCTQPWLTGLPMDERIFDPTYPAGPAGPTTSGACADGPGEKRVYLENPHKAQQKAFFDLLGECITAGLMDSRWIQAEIDAGYVRPDLFEVLRRYGYVPGKPQAWTLEKAYLGTIDGDRDPGRRRRATRSP